MLKNMENICSAQTTYKNHHALLQTPDAKAKSDPLDGLPPSSASERSRTPSHHRLPASDETSYRSMRDLLGVVTRTDDTLCHQAVAPAFSAAAQRERRCRTAARTGPVITNGAQPIASLRTLSKHGCSDATGPPLVKLARLLVSR